MYYVVLFTFQKIAKIDVFSEGQQKRQEKRQNCIEFVLNTITPTPFCPDSSCSELGQNLDRCSIPKGVGTPRDTLLSLRAQSAGLGATSWKCGWGKKTEIPALTKLRPQTQFPLHYTVLNDMWICFFPRWRSGERPPLGARRGALRCVGG